MSYFYSQLIELYSLIGSLREYCMKKNPLPVNTIRNYTAHILLGLNYIHSRDIIHYAIKTQNIYLDKNFNCKIGEFSHTRKIVDFVVDFATIPGNYIILLSRVAS